MRVGYGRVSTRDQRTGGQARRLVNKHLLAVGRDECVVLGFGMRARPGAALANRAGDQLVITKLDRLGRSLEHLIEPAVQSAVHGIRTTQNPAGRAS
jgi:DNA invertase Pin-like site-specific DNA recombinase